jgi:hypothetical protein
MNNSELDKVVFYSKEDISGPLNLLKGECLLMADIKTNYTDINEVLELYNLKKYFDNNLYLKSWSKADIDNFKLKVSEYGKIVGRFMAEVNNNNFLHLYEIVTRDYVHSFWELVNNQNIFKSISKIRFQELLKNEPNLIHEILTHKKIVEHYDLEIKNFLLTYSQSAEILISFYEEKEEFITRKMYVPKRLTKSEKETIISNYLDSRDVNFNYIRLIQNARNQNEFKISDKTRLKAKKLYKSKSDLHFGSGKGTEYGVSVCFPINAKKNKDFFIDSDFTINYTYSLDFIMLNNDPYSLFKNFIDLFEYVDVQRRINLVSKKNNMGLIERIIGVHSQFDYRIGTEFNLKVIASQLQIGGYYKVLIDLGLSLETILLQVFTFTFPEKYGFASNARFSIPTATSNFEKVRLLAPEFESVLKQFKLFVEDGIIDFDLLQISSNPTSIRDIPSLNKNKYLYLNKDNKEVLNCINLLFSDQTSLTYVEPFKEKKYTTFFDLLKEEKVKFSHYEEYQKAGLNYLIEKGLLYVDSNNFIQILCKTRIIILNDLFVNEVASFHRYSLEFRQEVEKMKTEKMIYFDNTLFSKPEQDYFNYFLNKSEFTNGLDLRNSYLHGTQAIPDEIQKHEYHYLTYLKLLTLVFLKMEDDLIIHKVIKDNLEK